MNRLQNDPRYQEAKKLLFAALRDVQRDITDIRPPVEDRKAEYQKMIQDYNAIRGFPLFYPYIGSGIGNGPFVELEDGSVKYDLISGIGVHYFGHSYPDSLIANVDAAMSDTIMQGNLQQNSDALELSALLASLSGLDHVFLSSSGAMACENALKIAFQKKQPATRILAFERCFAGRTLALSQITDKPSFREGLPATVFVDYVPFYDEKNPGKSIQALKAHLARYPKQHAIMCLELIQGEAGFWVGEAQFFKEICTVLKEHGIAVWIDEIQTFARTEKLFAFQHFGLDQFVDIVTIGKASQVCATLYTKALCPKPLLLSQTFTSSTTAIQHAIFMIETAMQNGFFGPQGKIAKLHEAFSHRLQKLPVDGPFGIGAMVAFTPFDGDAEKVKRFLQKLFENGVIAFMAGSNPTRVRFLLPVGCLELEQVDAIMKIVEKTIKEMQ